MALYPDTSCFYRAEVIASPRDLQASRVSVPLLIPQRPELTFDSECIGEARANIQAEI